MVSGLCATLGLRVEMTFPLIKKFRHLLVALVENSKPSSLKTIISHGSPKFKDIALGQIMKLT